MVNIISILAVSAGMYRTCTYTGIETPTFCTGLNIGRTGYIGRFRAILAGIGHIDLYKKKLYNFIFLMVL